MNNKQRMTKALDDSIKSWKKIKEDPPYFFEHACALCVEGEVQLEEDPKDAHDTACGYCPIGMKNCEMYDCNETPYWDVYSYIHAAMPSGRTKDDKFLQSLIQDGTDFLEQTERAKDDKFLQSLIQDEIDFLVQIKEEWLK